MCSQATAEEDAIRAAFTKAQQVQHKKKLQRFEDELADLIDDDQDKVLVSWLQHALRIFPLRAGAETKNKSRNKFPASFFGFCFDSKGERSERRTVAML